MTPAAIIEKAAREGVILALSPAGAIKATGERAAVSRWLPLIRDQKPAIVAALGSDRDDLETAIRHMAGYWEYSPAELAWALAYAAEDPEGWRKLVDFDAKWRRDSLSRAV